MKKDPRPVSVRICPTPSYTGRSRRTAEVNVGEVIAARPRFRVTVETTQRCFLADHCPYSEQVRVSHRSDIVQDRANHAAGQEART